MLYNRISRLKRPLPYMITVLMLFLKALLLREYLFGRIAWGQVAADLASIVVLVGIFDAISPMKAKKYALLALNLVVSALFFASAVYFNYFSTIPTYSALNELHQVGGVKDSVNAAIQLRDYWFFADIVILIVVWLSVRIRGGIQTESNLKHKALSKMWTIGVVAVAIVGLIVSQLYIKSAESIENELAQAEEIGFFNYQVSAALNNSKAVVVDNTDEGPISWSGQLAELEAANPNVQVNTIDPVGFGRMAGKNVIVIQMEAFQNFPIHLKVGEQFVTPILNELADNGYYLPHFFQQIGQGNTSDAEFMSNTSIYPTAKIAMSTGYGDRNIPSLPKLLEGRGYTAETFHVNDVTFWDRDKLYPALEFNKYFDKPYFENDNFNAFGASDEQLYKTAVQQMVGLKQENKPFYMQLITASSHHPFKIPQDKQTLTLPDPIAGTQLGDYLEAVHYTDYAIGELIKLLKENDLYNDTMLVIYGDHFGLQPQDNDPQDVSEKLGITYHERISRFNIPLIIRVPGDAPRQVIKTVGGQVDIMPTIANLLGVSLKKEEYLAFGHDLLNTDKNVFGMRYYLPTGSFFNNDILFVPGKSFEDGMAWSLDTMEPVPDFSAYRGDYDYVLKLMKLSDAFVETLPKR